MADTRDGSIGGDRQQEGRRPPTTTSERRRREEDNQNRHVRGRGRGGRYVAREVDNDVAADAVDIGPSHACTSTSQPPVEAEPQESVDRSSTFPYPGGPNDRSVLYSYGSHIARDIWDGLERPLDGHKQKVHNHSMKDTDLHPEIQEYIKQSGLMPIHDVGFTAVNHFLATAFVERWHKETNTFHLPVGEMTITLDDVAQLLHIPIVGAFYDFVEPRSKMEAANWLIDYLGVDREEANTKGTSVTFGWLEMVYKRAIEDQRWEDAARCYLFMLLGRTLFSDKSGNRVKVGFLYMIRDLDTVGQYCWGAMALAHLYKQLTDASSPNVSQIGGYGTLLQAWIFEHFQEQIFGNKWINDVYNEEEPRAKRWECKRHDGSLIGFREALDHLASDQVTWMPYANPHHRPLERVAFFKGFLRHARSMLAYNPDRVVRQFGWIQDIPQDPKPSGRPVVIMEENDFAWINFNNNLIHEGTPVVDGRPTIVQGYMTWFRKVSHPYMKAENYLFNTIQFKEALSETLYLYDELETVLEHNGIPRGSRGWQIIERLKEIAQPELRKFCMTYHQRERRHNNV